MADCNSFDFLCRCLSRQEKGRNDPAWIRRQITSGSVNWQDVIAIGDQHFVLPLLYYQLTDKGLTACLPDDLQDNLATLYELNRLRNEQLKKQLTSIVKLFNFICVTPVLLKGATALFSELYPDPACRMMNDLDILVPADLLSNCAALLQKEGYSPMEGDEIYDDHHHCRPLAHPDHLARVELHREIGAEPVAQLLSSEAIRNEAITIRRDGMECQLCSNTHLALHNIIHHQHSGTDFYRQRTVSLYQMYDLVQLMYLSQGDDIVDWQNIFHQLKQNGYAGSTASYFLSIKHFFSQPVPPAIQVSTAARLDWLLVKIQLQSAFFRYYFQMMVHILRDKKNRKIFMRQLCSPQSYKMHVHQLASIFQKNEK